MKNLRMKIANWISGGELEENERLFAHWYGAANDCYRTLSDIASMETPNANATVKRMARVAREAIGE